MDRMIAILGALLEENDAGSRPAAHEFRIPGEYTDMEITRVGVYSAVCQITTNYLSFLLLYTLPLQTSELTGMGLLHRTSPSDRLDGPPMFKCAVSFDAVLGLAKELDVALNDLLWDPM